MDFAKRMTKDDLVILLISGGGSSLMALPRKGISIEGATILDVTPTVLALLGLPVGLDMEGGVLTRIFEEDFLKHYPIRIIQSYDKWLHSKSRKITSPAEEEYADLLRAIGYLK